ncbi:MAG: transglycosylase domain-containing protein, partial [Deltaproteobacteria bacterium]|nr:transglycosylase domain-containing protein [Deltaproteobacteria bacterium]
KTLADLKPIPVSLIPDSSDISRLHVLDRNYSPLNISYQNQWNTHDYVPLYEIPDFLQQAFIISEDKRFFHHSGVDRTARINATWQNLKTMKGARGASTISEQVVKMLHPRKRTLWARWLEGFEAGILERFYSKAEILEFYLNEVPYASNRRGVVQAARLFFDRDLSTLSRKEMLALAVMVRAPSRFDLRKDKNRINKPVYRLARLCVRQGLLDNEEAENLLNEEFRLQNTEFDFDAGHFVDHIFGNYSNTLNESDGQIVTTLDSAIQSMSKTFLDNRIRSLSPKGVKNGAVLVVNNKTREVLSWVVSGTRSENIPGSWIDAVTAPRQPGSTLKPFVYAMALEKGWTAATVIDDTPLAEPVGTGLHSYNNYSRINYGKLPLRQCLGNSLNIPAVKTLQHIGVEKLLSCLKSLGMQSLRHDPDFYGDGLVLGNGEITLFELVQAYSTFACNGIYEPLKVIVNDLRENAEPPVKVFSPEVASLVGNILSDSSARLLEFGAGGVLNFPVQTAVKTGTSNDYRDAWAVGYNNDYTVGVWMGNLDRTAMDRITGAKGPGIVLRSIFSELNRNRDTKPLYLSSKLVQMDVCRDTGMPANGECPSYSEWFVPGSTPVMITEDMPAPEKNIEMIQPSPGLRLAMDPRIPDDYESFRFSLSGVAPDSKVEWYVDNRLEAVTESGDYLWPMRKGNHTVMAKVFSEDNGQKLETQDVEFLVK